MTSTQQGRGRGSRIGAVLAIGMLLAGCGDFGTGPDGPSASARGDPVVIEGVTVTPPPGGCRTGSCTGDDDGGSPAPGADGNDGSTRQGGGGTRSGPSKPNEEAKCVSAGLALGTAMAYERAMKKEYEAEKRQSTSAAVKYMEAQRRYAPDGLTSAEARHLAELKGIADRERGEAEKAERSWSNAKVAVEFAKAAVIALCTITGPF